MQEIHRVLAKATDLPMDAVFVHGRQKSDRRLAIRVVFFRICHEYGVPLQTMARYVGHQMLRKPFHHATILHHLGTWETFIKTPTDSYCQKLIEIYERACALIQRMDFFANVEMVVIRHPKVYKTIKSPMPPGAHKAYPGLMDFEANSTTTIIKELYRKY